MSSIATSSNEFLKANDVRLPDESAPIPEQKDWCNEVQTKIKGGG